MGYHEREELSLFPFGNRVPSMAPDAKSRQPAASTDISEAPTPPEREATSGDDEGKARDDWIDDPTVLIRVHDWYRLSHETAMHDVWCGDASEVRALPDS